RLAEGEDVADVRDRLRDEAEREPLRRDAAQRAEERCVPGEVAEEEGGAEDDDERADEDRDRVTPHRQELPEAADEAQLVLLDREERQPTDVIGRSAARLKTPDGVAAVRRERPRPTRRPRRRRRPERS